MHSFCLCTQFENYIITQDSTEMPEVLFYQLNPFHTILLFFHFGIFILASCLFLGICTCLLGKH